MEVKFETNALILKLAMIAYNILRIIGTESMKKNDRQVEYEDIEDAAESLIHNIPWAGFFEK